MAQEVGLSWPGIAHRSPPLPAPSSRLIHKAHGVNNVETHASSSQDVTKMRQTAAAPVAKSKYSLLPQTQQSQK